MINGDFTSIIIKTDTYSKIYMNFESKEAFDECKTFSKLSKEQGLINELLENKNSLLIVVNNIVAELYEKELIDFITTSISARNKAIEAALEVYAEEMKKHVERKTKEIKDKYDL